jgi:hypothetical protein
MVNPEVVAAEAINRGVHPIYQDRIRDMASNGWIVKGHPHGDQVVSPYTEMHVLGNWPLDGKIVLRRQDGAVVTLKLVGKTFKVLVRKG